MFSINLLQILSNVQYKLIKDLITHVEFLQLCILLFPQRSGIIDCSLFASGFLLTAMSTVTVVISLTFSFTSFSV